MQPFIKHWIFRVASFISFQEPSLQMGRDRTRFTTYSTHQKQTQVMTAWSGYTDRQYKPMDLFPGISFSTRLEVSGEGMILQQNALVQDRTCAIASPGTTSKSLAGIYVTKECNHPYYDIFKTKPHQVTVHGGLSTSNLKQGLFIAGTKDPSSIFELWLQAVDQNEPGQQLAYQNFGAVGCLTVLQRGCCIGCACKMVQEAFRSGKGALDS